MAATANWTLVRSRGRGHWSLRTRRSRFLTGAAPAAGQPHRDHGQDQHENYPRQGRWTTAHDSSWTQIIRAIIAARHTHATKTVAAPSLLPRGQIAWAPPAPRLKLPKVEIPQGLLLAGIDAQPFGEILLDRAVLRRHLVEGGFEILLLHAEEGQEGGRSPSVSVLAARAVEERGQLLLIAQRKEELTVRLLRARQGDELSVRLLEGRLRFATAQSRVGHLRIFHRIIQMGESRLIRVGQHVPPDVVDAGRKFVRVGVAFLGGTQVEVSLEVKVGQLLHVPLRNIAELAGSVDELAGYRRSIAGLVAAQVAQVR